MTINEKLTEIQVHFKSKKSRYNAFGKYNFRSAEDILEATKPFLEKLGITVVIEETLMSGWEFPILETKASLSDGENSIYATALTGVDLNQKGMQMPQKFGSASSYGKKYALGNLFLIDDTADSDANNQHNTSGITKQVKKPVLKGDALAKAKTAIKEGKFTVEMIQRKYEITPDVLKTL